MDGLQEASSFNTLTAVGVTWGLRILTPGEPFAGAADFSPNTKKIMIVLTDGDQKVRHNHSTCTDATNSKGNYSFDPATMGLAGSELSGTGLMVSGRLMVICTIRIHSTKTPSG